MEEDAVEDEIEDEIDLAALDPLEPSGPPPPAAPSRPPSSRPTSSGVPVLSELPSHYELFPPAPMPTGAGLDDERWSRRREEPSDPVELTQKGQTSPDGADSSSAFSARACTVM